MIILKKTFKITALAFSAMILLSTTACSQGEANNESSTLSEYQSIVSETRSITTNESFNIKKAFNSIQINGTMLPSPPCISDFGNDFTLGTKLFSGDENNSGRLVGNLLSNKAKAISYDIYNVSNDEQSDEKKLKELKLDIISQENIDVMESKALLSVLGITVGDSMDDADKAFGMPDSRSMSEKNSGTYTYTSSEDTSKMISLEFTDNIVTKITIYYSVRG